MNETKKIRILCVDDHAEIRRVFELVMQDQPEFELVGTSQSAEGLESRVEELSPDVVILDMSMPGRSPLQAMHDTRAKFPEVRFLVSSAYDDGRRIEEAFDAGATGYLVKGGTFDELSQAIRDVAHDEKVTPRGFALRR